MFSSDHIDYMTKFEIKNNRINKTRMTKFGATKYRKAFRNQTYVGRYLMAENKKNYNVINTGVQGKNNVLFHKVNKVENVLENTYIFDLFDNVEYVVYALYSRIA